VLRKVLRRVSLFLLVFVLIWAVAAALDAVAEPQAFRPEPEAVAATLPSQSGFAGQAGDGASREMIACSAAVLTLVVLISMLNRGHSDGGGADSPRRTDRPDR
jgi:ABC-type nitrate/sulfonate/bicarbonate transport system permease component